jgi:hypothetical protein
MIDVASEPLISLRDAAKLIPPARQGRAVSFQCILRWVLEGAKAPNGERVHLEALRLGGRYVTSHAAIQRFAEALTPRTDTRPSPHRTPRQRRRAAERAEKELERMGI